MSNFHFLLGASAIVGFAVTPRPGMALIGQPVVSTLGAVEKVRAVCDEFGRCRETGPAYPYGMRGPSPGYRYVPPNDYGAYGYEYGPRFQAPSKWQQKGFCPPGQHKKGNC